MIKKLIGERVALTPITPDHADLIATWMNDLEVAIPLGDEAWDSITAARAGEGIGNSRNDFLIVAAEDDTPIGRCLLFHVNQVDRNAMLGIAIGDKRYWGRGYGGEAISLLLEHAFNLLNLESVMLGTYAFNTRAVNCYRRLGFREIGRRRRARRIAGVYHDEIMMDLLAEEFHGRLVADHVDRFAPERTPGE